jgi:predicted nucleic acid-binding protein
MLRLALGEDATTTPAVMAELAAGEDVGLVPVCDWEWLTVLEPTHEERKLAEALLGTVDRGEAQCLAVARMREGKFVSDDFAARRLAREHDVVISGTLGILLALVDARHLSLEDADRLLATMMSHGYRSPVKSLGELLA